MSDEPVVSEKAPSFPTPEVVSMPISALPDVEPLLGFDAFVVMAMLSRPAAQAFRLWLTIHQHDPHGYYARAEWDAWYHQLLAHH